MNSTAFGVQDNGAGRLNCSRLFKRFFTAETKASQHLRIVLDGQMVSVRIDLQSGHAGPGVDCLDQVVKVGAKSLERRNEPGNMKPIKI